MKRISQQTRIMPDHSRRRFIQGLAAGRAAPPDARDPHAYSDGYDFGDIPRLRLADEKSFSLVLLDRLERVESSDNASAYYAGLRFWF